MCVEKLVSASWTNTEHSLVHSSYTYAVKLYEDMWDVCHKQICVERDTQNIAMCEGQDRELRKAKFFGLWCCLP